MNPESDSVRAVSVIIPTRDEPSVQDAILSVLANTSAVPFEVLVVGTTNRQWIPADPRVRWIETPVEELAAAKRNRGAEAAQGDLLLFTDADCMADSDWIANAVAAIECALPRDAEANPLRPDRRSGDPGHRQILGGGIRFPRNYWDLADNLAVFHHLHVSCKARMVGDYLGANNLAVRRNAFVELGGFNPALWVGEDWDLLNRFRAAGHAVRFDPSFAVLHNSGRNSAAKVIAHARSYGEGYAKLLLSGRIPSGRFRMDALGRLPPAAAVWSALRAKWETLRAFTRPLSMLRYLHTAPAVWLFYYVRRMAVFRTLASTPSSALAPSARGRSRRRGRSPRDS